MTHFRFTPVAAAFFRGSCLHYAVNSPLAGDGTYEATISVGVPGSVARPQTRT